jgi:hypothetical protein
VKLGDRSPFASVSLTEDRPFLRVTVRVRARRAPLNGEDLPPEESLGLAAAAGQRGGGMSDSIRCYSQRTSLASKRNEDMQVDETTGIADPSGREHGDRGSGTWVELNTAVRSDFDQGIPGIRPAHVGAPTDETVPFRFSVRKAIVGLAVVECSPSAPPRFGRATDPMLEARRHGSTGKTACEQVGSPRLRLRTDAQGGLGDAHTRSCGAPPQLPEVAGESARLVPGSLGGRLVCHSRRRPGRGPSAAVLRAPP